MGKKDAPESPFVNRLFRNNASRIGPFPRRKPRFPIAAAIKKNYLSDTGLP